ncbi:MAG TPA: methyltransferase domain-containing protein [Tepidisphaeraceae bacterium]|nr:methyltransferase domain-containing protein [Tepidisphaeraceae bacterium]
MTLQLEKSTDNWSEWLLGRRHGNDSAYQRRMLEVVRRYRDRVLDGAKLREGMTLADVGTGDGLLAFGAIERIGPTLQVVLTDISEPLLRHVEETAEKFGVSEQCRFVQGSADKLAGIDDASVDAVGVRAVLAYVGDKAAAFREFYRVLRPGGRMSIAEPIFQDEAFEACALGKIVQMQPNRPDIEFLKLVQRYRSAQFPATHEEAMRNPITNYNERDLFRFARDAGFVNLHLELHIDLQPALPISWEAYLDVANHPWAPTLREILAERFSKEEAEVFTRTLKPVVENGQSVQKQLTVYITADKPE